MSLASQAVRWSSVAFAAWALVASTASLGAQQTTSVRLKPDTTAMTVWDGVYTEPQAARGQGLYKEACGHCHRDNLTGGGSEAGAPALIGPIFTVRWKDQPLSDMFVTIGTTMPKNKPDSMTPAVVADIVSFILKANDFPAGQRELPPSLDALKQIAVVQKQ
jgi:mono/diheme cytochrome c family protein